eukprot:IDg12327t1
MAMSSVLTTLWRTEGDLPNKPRRSCASKTKSLSQTPSIGHFVLTPITTPPCLQLNETLGVAIVCGIPLHAWVECFNV